MNRTAEVFADVLWNPNNTTASLPASASWNATRGVGGGGVGGLSSEGYSLPREMTFTSDSLIAVIFYAILLVIGAAGNLTVFVTLFRARQRRSRVNRFIMHLCLADMIVVFIMMPLEIGWHLTVSWEAGDVACRGFMFFRALGFYLSSFILVVISVDRLCTVVRPMKSQEAERRGKLMLALAWILSAVASAPQVSPRGRGSGMCVCVCVCVCVCERERERERESE